MHFQGKWSRNGRTYSLIIPRDAGATRITWSMKDNEGNETRAYTTVFIKKPVKELKINGTDDNDTLPARSPGKGRRIKVTSSTGYTDTKDFSFSVKGKGFRISKSGFITATVPGAAGTVTVKCGKESFTANITAARRGSDIIQLRAK